MPIDKMFVDKNEFRFKATWKDACVQNANRHNVLDKMPLNKMSKDIMPVDNMSVYKL